MAGMLATRNYHLRASGAQRGGRKHGAASGKDLSTSFSSFDSQCWVVRKFKTRQFMIGRDGDRQSRKT